MQLTPPTQITWVISVILVILGLIAHLGLIPALSAVAFWMVFIAALLLILAAVLKGV
jgi:hypothetical protein